MVDIVELTVKISDRTDPQLAFNTRSGGPGVDGSEQILTPLSERWTWRCVIPILNKQDARAIRVVKSRLKGRAMYLLARVCDQYRITRKDIGGGPVVSVPHSDDAYFSDTGGYAASSPRSPITADAAENSGQIRIRASDLGGYMVAGVFISINYFLYQIDAWELDDTDYVLDISPPLRAAVTTEHEADFDAKCLWRLVSDSEGQLDLVGGRFGAVTLSLIEPIGRESA